MEKCLITKLDAIVDDSSLPVLEEYEEVTVTESLTKEVGCFKGASSSDLSWIDNGGQHYLIDLEGFISVNGNVIKASANPYAVFTSSSDLGTAIITGRLYGSGGGLQSYTVLPSEIPEGSKYLVINADTYSAETSASLTHKVLQPVSNS